MGLAVRENCTAPQKQEAENNDRLDIDGLASPSRYHSPTGLQSVTKTAQSAVFFYHQLAFAELNKKYHEQLQDALIDQPRKFRESHFLKRLPIANTFGGQEYWEVCKVYLANLEAKFEDLISGHSVFFWLHLYRRIGVMLSPAHENKIDPTTTALVRKIAELAISKYGKTADISDMARSQDLFLKDAMGGYLKRAWEKHLGIKSAIKLFKQMSPQWIMKSFKPDDYIQIYCIEGFSYEYWRTTASMRATGKGAILKRGARNWPEYIDDDEFESLILSYDKRIQQVRANHSLTGLWFDTSRKEENSDLIAFSPSYNVERIPYSNLPHSSDIEIGPNFVSNFTPSIINLSGYYSVHALLGDSFREVNGIEFNALLITLWGISQQSLGGVPDLGTFRNLSEKETQGLNLINLLQRAYTIHTGNVTTLSATIKELYEAHGSEMGDVEQTSIAACLEYLTLNTSRQSQIGIWSGGPGYSLLPLDNNSLLLNLVGADSLLSTLFYRVPTATKERGTIFEKAFRRSLSDHGYNVVKSGEITAHNGQKREIDASVRVENSLILFECRSIERPLDYEISKPQTMERRTKFLKEKIEQILSLRDFISSHPTGKNYDFGWANSIEAVVISPFVEWIWERSERTWIDSRTPRVMQADEAIEWLGTTGEK